MPGMRPARSLLIPILATLLAPWEVSTAGAIPPPGTDCRVFPGNSYWHADVRSLPVHPRSRQWIRSMGGRDRLLHPDFGPSGGQPYGIPFDVVGASHRKVRIDFRYASESDRRRYPFGPDITIEGGSDRHALMVHRGECHLYELFDARWNGGDPKAGSGAIFDLGSNALRPAGWTSADAAGLPIFAGLIRRDEVEAGRIDHAIRMTAEETDHRFLWPARHRAGARRDRSLPPMGAWFRLKGSFPLRRYLPETRVVLRAMKVHGMIVADNGSDWYFGGASERGWRHAVLDELKSIPAGAFQAVDSRLMKAGPNSGRVKPRYVGG
jgi:hypothetical protein